MTPDQLAHLHALCFTTPRPWHAAEFASLLTGPGITLISHEHGFLLGRILAPEAEVLTLAVDPSHRRQGIASNLLHDFTEAARNQHTQQIFLEVIISNQAALALYTAAGFTRTGQRKDYYQTPNGQRASAFVLARDLTQPDPLA